MISCASLVMENQRLAIDIFNNDVYPSVVVQIAKRGSPARFSTHHRTTYQVADIAKGAVLPV